MIIILSGRDVAQGCMLRAISSLGGWVYTSPIRITTVAGTACNWS